MIRVLGLDHVVYRTSNLKQMLWFYQELLGCTVERELAPEVGLIQLRAGHALIDIVPVESELGKQGGQAPNQLAGRQIDHVCLQIAPQPERDLTQWLAKHGISASPWAERYGATGFGRSVYINDPEGNVVELKLVQTPSE